MLKKCHFIGIGGIGMSGLAKLLLQKKSIVTGSDLAESYTTEKLIQQGATIHVGHCGSYVTPDLTVIYSTDIKPDNPEYIAAIQKKCNVIHRSDLLKLLMEEKKAIAVTGTHGKTTTTSLLTCVLKESGADPSFAVGGIIPQYDSNAGHGCGDHFVLEADESDGTFLKYLPYGAIITNIGLDHMNHFGSEEILVQAFETFMHQVQSHEHLFWCGDDYRLQNIARKGVSYGFSPNCDLIVQNARQEGWSTFFDAIYKGKKYQNIELNLIGRHNILNALAVFGLCIQLGIEEAAIRKVFREFKGVKRRAEKKGEHHGVLVIDDYAHHPTEIKTTLKGIREAIGERRLVVVFQPHRYSRTRDCLGTYGSIFEEADKLIVTDIYSAHEEPISGVSVEKVMEDIKLPAAYISRVHLTQTLSTIVRPHDVVVTLGAGDVTKIGAELLELLRKNGVTKYQVGVVYGGRSSEHEVSVLSSRFMIDNLKQDLYDVHEFAISKEGTWNNGDQNISHEVMTQVQKCDLFIPITHGNFGEDGTLQGFFEMLDKPYTGPDHRSCAICMDKGLLKAVWLNHGIRTSPFIVFTQFQWNNERNSIISQIHHKLQYPVYVKGPHLGSSIAVSRVENENQLDAAVDLVMKYDSQILVENEVKGREIEFAVLGNDRISVFDPGEVSRSGDIYSYDDKYTENGPPSILKADLSPETLARGKEIVKEAYRLAGCSVFSRVDTFFTEDGNFLMNEINPLPGCTPYSMFPKMCEANGLNGPELLDRIVVLALERKRMQQKYSNV